MLVAIHHITSMFLILVAPDSDIPNLQDSDEFVKTLRTLRCGVWKANCRFSDNIKVVRDLDQCFLSVLDIEKGIILCNLKITQ